ncbi:molybdopterin-dependent oxidoreductase [Nocardioides zeae]|uniref:Molybdopterin-dependent oxidoreductase n=1 Tax=Nocardioides imazamoxiresistens TaxID=3231893 RepID=A0ABU3PY63_9ACTN|nr:molybdopterin-dependent oxidoreductase [Nocardioides zeae]MDT9594170.1 molybdopterin-dependent oxidoreductase [Nocardioides zeae]
MREARLLWSVVGVAAAALGAGLGELAAGALTLRNGPVLGFREAVVVLLPDEFVVHNGIDLVAIATGPLLVVLFVGALVALAASAGVAAADGSRRPAVLALLVGLLGLGSEWLRPDSSLVDVVPVLLGVLGFGAGLTVLRRVLRRQGVPGPDEGPDEGLDPDPTEAPQVEAAPDAPARVAANRRTVLGAAAATAALGLAAAVVGEVVGRGRRAVEQGRRLLRLTMISAPQEPADVAVGLDEVAPWTTPNDDFYRQDAAVVVPAIAAEEWTLRIHGEVEREVVLSYEQLIGMAVREQWVTLVGLTYEPGGGQVGNAWWSGVPTHRLLQLAGVRTGADAVVQTGDDGWRCVTATQVLEDPGRRALLAFAMNGEALPLEHGFPARTVVPGLYGGVSACKWVVDWEVTRLDVVEASWDEDRPLRAPVRIASRIDTPADGAELVAGPVEVGGVAWAPPIGVGAVEVEVDGGGWELAALGAASQTDAWAQWRTTLDLAPGTHRVRVRVRDRVGVEQEDADEDDASGDEASGDAATGAVGLHEIQVEVVEPD